MSQGQWRLVDLVIPCLAVIGLLGPSSAVGALADRDHFATVYGYGLDKWATAWLLIRSVNPDATLTVVERFEALPAEATPFDMPEAEIRRTGDRSAFTSVLDQKTEVSELERRLGRIVHSIEVAYWESESSSEALSVEHAFRRLQRNNGDRVSPECYLQFFDSVVAAMSMSAMGAPLPSGELLSNCPTGSSGSVVHRLNPVRELPISRVLNAIREGKEVVFVDVRESGEFAEIRIPGAVNLPIRALNEAAVSKFHDADLVISYCVKDFRGFEMAKLLRRAGVRNSVILKPYGLKGWITSGLPVAGSEALSDAEARRQLERCLASGGCIERDS